MLIGEHRHTIDDKSRVSLPAKFRKEMGKSIILAKGFDKCIYAFTPKEWQDFSGKLSQETLRSDNRGLNRFMFAGASEADVDSIGRILIPDFLAEWAGLSEKVSILGVQNHVEIWNEKTWLDYKAQNERQADSLAEKVGGGK
jgi:MraZ protein